MKLIPQKKIRFSRLIAILLTLPAFPFGANCQTAFSDAERESTRKRLAELDARLLAVESSRGSGADRAPDARLYLKAVGHAVDFEPMIDAKGRDQIDLALKTGEGRIAQLEKGQHPWTAGKGRSLRGFISAVDGSPQPYYVFVPKNYDPAKPIRLDVFLHGSMPRSAIGELDFILNGPGGGGADFLELRPLGRLGENAYRFEGETDVFEAIESVCQQFYVDRRRMVLRGASLGGVATWQIGLKRPDRFAALGPSAGPVDTRLFAAAPWPHFIKLDPLTSWEEKTLHMVDAIDYAANGGMVPVVAAMGDKDPYFPSHLQAEKAFAAEGIPFTGLVAEGAGHGLNAKTLQEQLRLVGERAAEGLPSRPPKIRFVTWTLKFSRCHWVELLGLKSHYERAEIEASLAEDGSVAVSKVENITRFALHPPALRTADGISKGASLTIGGQPVALPLIEQGAPKSLVFVCENGAWKCLGDQGRVELTGKRPGLQGPIDDAFASPFLCVRGTGKPANEAVGRWADANLRRFQWEWSRHYRGRLPIKNDTEVTPEDIRERHLILFGDPGSNRWIQEVVAKLRVPWSSEALQVGSVRYSGAEHALAMIAPNPLPGATGRYVVLNSGHTYHDAELRLSYMVFPRLGDWAVIRVGENPQSSAWAAAPTSSGAIPMPKVEEQVVTSGFSKEDWTLP